VFSQVGDKSTFGGEAVRLVGVTHVTYESAHVGDSGRIERILAIYHTKLIPTTEITVALNWPTAELTLVFNGTHRVTLPPLSALREIALEDVPQSAVLWQVSDTTRVCGHHVKLLTVN
jgi:hypothetical protein